ncbi:hypothetical protein CPB86DRAFT_325003 [Serendipita vermifera]|nr:hypothetical protein CPB86DRAFT_325003 [Serendipita vermifera]
MIEKRDEVDDVLFFCPLCYLSSRILLLIIPLLGLCMRRIGHSYKPETFSTLYITKMVTASTTAKRLVLTLRGLESLFAYECRASKGRLNGSPRLYNRTLHLHHIFHRVMNTLRRQIIGSWKNVERAGSIPSAIQRQLSAPSLLQTRSKHYLSASAKVNPQHTRVLIPNQLTGIF